MYRGDTGYYLANDLIAWCFPLCSDGKTRVDGSQETCIRSYSSSVVELGLIIVSDGPQNKNNPYIYEVDCTLDPTLCTKDLQKKSSGHINPEKEG